MRQNFFAFWGLFSLALVLLPVSSGQGQFGVLPSIQILTDPSGDVVAGTYGNPLVALPVPYPSVDLVGLALAETPTSVLVYIGIAAMPDPTDPVEQQAAPDFFVAFRFAEHDVIGHIDTSGAAGVDYTGYLCLGTWELREPCVDAPVAALPSLTAIGIQIDRTSLAALTGEEPTKGQVLNDWRAQSLWIRPGGSLWVGDLLNDPIDDPAAYTLQFGVKQQSPLRLSSESSYFVSNGLATSYPYRVALANDDGKLATVRLAAQDIPRGWQVTLPDAEVTIEPESTREVVLVVTVPFFHRHGAVERFLLTASSEGRPTASLDLGVIYTATPQPTGHHNTLSIHSLAGGADGFISTLDEDPGATGEPIRSAPAGSNITWDLDLQPALATGMDFDLKRQGTIEVVVRNSNDVPGMYLEGSLDLINSSGRLVLARIATDPIDGVGQEATTLTGTIQPTPEANLIDHHEGDTLVLHLELRGNDLGQLAANPFFSLDSILGGTLVLPLFDYHDDVDAVIQALSGLVWTTESKELQGAPGSILGLPVRLESSTGEHRRIRVQVDSNPIDLARFEGPGEALVDARAPLSGHVVFTIPTDAYDGQLLDAVVVAQDQAGSGALAVLRIVVVVDSSLESVQFVSVEDQGRDASAPSFVLTALVFAAFAWIRKGKS